MSEPNPPVSISDLRVFQLEPNLTAFLPGPCQARCAFCMEPEGPDPESLATWLAAFSSLMNQLPPLFRLLSISGGEPTLSPVFGQLLEIARDLRESERLNRVVLTTNGGLKTGGENTLFQQLEALRGTVTHVNISRHAVDDILNTSIFKPIGVPSGRPLVPRSSELAILIDHLNRCGIPVNINCVYSSNEAFGRRLAGLQIDELRADAHNFIKFAREIGASSVTFRHDHRDAHLESPTKLETAFDDVQTVHEAYCESCRVVGKLISGIPVNFKRSAYEPVALHYEGELYEMVFHSNGVLYRDWSRNYPIAIPLPVATPTPEWERLLARHGDKSGLAPAECDNRQPTCNLMKVV